MKTSTLLLTLFLSSSAHAFQILSVLTNPCHENITMGVFGYGAQEFHANPAATALFSRYVAKVNQIGVPTDSATTAVIKEMTRRFHWQDYDEATKYILTSFVAGARLPDTRGFSIIDINHIRGNHLTDSAQAIHTLRKREDDGPDGNVSAIAATRAMITSTISGVLQGYAAGPWYRNQTWAFPFYGEQDVNLFWPAFDLGVISHSIEDSYSHTIRDASFNILSVSNYIDAMSESLNEERDGPPHSERLDQCNMADSFDNLRITEADRQLVRIMNEVDSLLGSGTTTDATVETILDDVYKYTPGCSASNRYCDAEWALKSREEISKPYNLGGCGVIKAPDEIDGGGPSPIHLVAAIALLLPLLVGLRLRAPR